MVSRIQDPFESLVSFEGCKTPASANPPVIMFESLVSFEGCKTGLLFTHMLSTFESLVSFEGCKTRLTPLANIIRV